MNPFSTSLPSMFHVGRLMFDVRQASRSLFILVSGILLLTSPPLPAQPGPNKQVSEIVTVSGANFHRWYGHAGRSYFIQVSDPSNLLTKWNWLPAIEAGNDEVISHVIGGTAPKVFYRLKYTDQLPGPNETLDTADFDGDGISNLDEIAPPPPLLAGDATDPLDPDTDHDGMNDGYERTHGFDPNDDGTTDPNIGPQGDIDSDGLTNAAELALGTNPNNRNTDGDSLDDGEDADPKEILVDWPKAAESSYLLIDVTPPDTVENGGSGHDLNDNGDVLFSYGIWAGGEWIARSAPAGSGAIPGNGGAQYDIDYGIAGSFNDDRQIFGDAAIQFTTTQLAGEDPLDVPTFWPAVQSSPSLIYDTAALWDDLPRNLPSIYRRVGISNNGGMAISIVPRPSGSSVAATERIERFSAAGVSSGVMDGTNGFHPNGSVSDRQVMTASGWVASYLVRTATTVQPAAEKVGLWDSTNAFIALPPEAEGRPQRVRLSDLPNNKVALHTDQLTPPANDTYTGRVFLPDATGTYKYVPSLSSQSLEFMAGDGTGMTSDNKLWRNGKLIPLRDLCPKIGELLDQGYSLFPLKANKRGTYLIQAQGPNGEVETKLASPIRIEGVDATVSPENLQAPDRGVDNISIRADKTPNNGNQSDMWIMAPIDRTNTVRFLSGASQALPLHLSAENATFTPDVLSSPDQQVTVTGTGTTTSESSLVVKIGAQEIPSSIKVKAMKRRNVKVAVHAVGLNVVPPEVPVIPAVADIQNYLNSVFSPQLNVDFTVTLGPAEVPLSWDIGRASVFELSGPGSEKLHEGNGTFDFKGGPALGQEDKYINLTLSDEKVDINVYILTRRFAGWYIQGGVVRSDSGTAGIARRTPRVILIDGKQNNMIIPIIAHEIGHCMIGYGHPNLIIDPLDIAAVMGWGPPQNRGVAPHDGVGTDEWKKRLLYSTTLPVSGKTMVKSEWDAAEIWLTGLPYGRPTP